MASYVPVIKNSAAGAILYVALRDQSNTKVFKANPSIASGDFKVSIDTGALANLDTLPSVSPASSIWVKITLSQAEINGDNIKIQCIDAAGAEWCDLIILIQTVARQIDDLAFPTISGRGLDVSAGGEAGIDWANVGSPTTTLGLSGTTIKTATDVETDMADIQTRLPAALVSGRVDASVGAMAANVLTATAIAADAITDAKVASDVTIASVTGAVGSVTGAVGSVTGAVGSVTGAVGSVSAGGITAASLATGAVDAEALATDAVTEIVAAVFARAFPVAYGSYTFDELVKMVAAVLLGKASGMGTVTGTFRNLADSADVIVATQDADGNRTAITRTP